MQRRSLEFNVAQADLNAVFTSAITVIIVLTAREGIGIMINCVNIALGFQIFFTTFPILLHHIVFLQFVTWKDAHRNIYYRLSSKGAVIKFASGSESESSQALISYNL